MSTKDDASLDHSSNGQSLVVQQSAPLGTRDLDWDAVPTYASKAGDSQNDPSVYLHAFRRHWLLGVVLGVLLAGILAVATWLLIPMKYTATALIEVAMNQDALVFTEQARTVLQEYDIYRNTQPQWLKSRFVLNAALRKPEINSLPIVEREKADPITWLEDELRVYFPGDAQLMAVSLSDVDPAQTTKVVQAVVDAYMTEVVDLDRTRKDQKLASLKRLLNTKDGEIRQQQRVFDQRIDELGTADKDALVIQNQNTMQELGMLRNQLTRIQIESRTYRSEYKAAEEALARLNESPAIGVELENRKEKDVRCRDLEEKIADLQQVWGSQQNVVKPGQTSHLADQLNDQLSLLQTQYNNRVEELKYLILENKRIELQETVADRTFLLQLAGDEEKACEAQITALQEKFETVGKSTVDLDMLELALEDLKSVRTEIANKYEALKVEMDSQPRIQLRQPAEEPKSVENLHLKAAMSVLTGMLGFALPLFIVIAWDVHKQRINSSEDVTKGLGLSVIGSVPMIPGRAIKRLDAPTKRNQQWNVRLAESIDSIAARLLRNAALDDNRVILITSAVSGEGKTTLATQIAMSLARAGKRTVLVDFDLRRPAIDKAFQLPLHPGVSEALCGQNDITTLPQPTGLANLEVITAGICDRHVLQALANGGDKHIFDELRKTYDFIIVDGSPILPVADSRYVSQHVDSVVLSVFRDYSRIPKVIAAREILEAFGVRDLEAVVTSSSEEGYGVVETATQSVQPSA